MARALSACWLNNALTDLASKARLKLNPCCPVFPSQTNTDPSDRTMVALVLVLVKNSTRDWLTQLLLYV